MVLQLLSIDLLLADKEKCSSSFLRYAKLCCIQNKALYSVAGFSKLLLEFAEALVMCIRQNHRYILNHSAIWLEARNCAGDRHQNLVARICRVSRSCDRESLAWWARKKYEGMSGGPEGIEHFNASVKYRDGTHAALKKIRLGKILFECTARMCINVHSKHNPHPKLSC